MLSPRWHKVLRDLWTNKSRTLLVIFSIAIGVFAFGGLFTARTIVLGDMLGQYTATNPANITLTLSTFDDDLVRWAERRPQITGAQGRAYYRIQLFYGDTEHTVNLYAFDDFSAITIDRIYGESGQWPPEKDEIVLERSFLSLVGAQVGDTLTLELPNGKKHNVRLVGSAHDLSVRPGRIQPDVAAYVSLSTLRGLNLPSLYNQLELTIAPGEGNPITGDTQSTVVADDFQREFRHLGISVEAVELREAAEGYWAEDVFSGLSVILLIVGFSSLALSGFLVFNTISGIIARQKRQIGMMKIIGASRLQITGVYLAMVTCFGVVAFIIAIPASLVLCYVLIQILVVLFNFDFPTIYIPAPILFLEIAVSLVSPILSAIVPILSGTRISAAEAISDHVVQSRNSPLDMLLARIRGLPRPFLLSLRNTFRRKGRLMLTLVTLTAAGALFISIYNVRIALNTDIQDLLSMVHFDVRVNLNGFYQADGIRDRVENVPGVAFAESWAVSQMRRVRPDGVRGETVTVYGLPPDSPFVDPHLDEGRWLNADDDYKVVVDGEWLEDEPGITVGDTITLILDGEEHDWEVVGILRATKRPAVYVPYEYLTRFLRTPDQTDAVMVRTTSNTTIFQENVALAIEDYLDLRDIDLTSTTTENDVTSGVTSSFNVLVLVLMGMAILVAAVGGLGLAGTMSLNVMERTREIGVLRAVGAATNSIRRIFIAEGLIIGLVSWLVAIPLGLPGTIFFGGMLGDVVFSRPLTFVYAPEGTLIWLVIVLFISGASSLMPAQRATRISIREALAYE